MFSYKIKSGYLNKPTAVARVVSFEKGRQQIHVVKICLYASGEKSFGIFVEITLSLGFYW